MPVIIIILFLLAANGAATVTFSMSMTWWAKGDGYHDLSPTEVGVLCCMAIFSTWLTSSPHQFLVQLAVLKSSGVYSITALNRLLTATMSVYDTTPIGRVLNIFTSDLNAVDLQLPPHLSELIFLANLLTAYLLLTVVIIPLVASIFLPCLLLASWAMYFYKRAPLQISRLERTYASFYISKLTEGIIGRTSIRSCDREKDFVKSLRSSIDDLNSIHFTGYACEAWASMAQSSVSTILYLFAGFMVLVKRRSLSPGLGFIVLTTSEDLNHFIQQIMELLTNVQRGMASVGRIRYYCEALSQEPPHHLPGFDPSNTWPKEGHIKFTNVAMRYRPSLPLALQDLNLEIKGGERVGIVGRTGAGKSSILTTLTRCVELASGQIVIDGVDISTIGIHDLRKKIAVIPQDPTMFKGTIRTNLVPYLPDQGDSSWVDGKTSDEPSISDDVLLDALVKSSLIPVNNTWLDDEIEQEKTHLLATTQAIDYRRSHLLNLNSPVLSGGTNLSQGERQLLMIARAIVRNSTIVLCDEATSAVDLETDSKVQESMRVGFAGKTVISIAHCIATIAHFDKVMVLDGGKVVEFGPPETLYRQPGSLFRALCEKSNVT